MKTITICRFFDKANDGKHASLILPGSAYSLCIDLREKLKSASLKMDSRMLLGHSTMVVLKLKKEKKDFIDEMNAFCEGAYLLQNNAR